MAIACYAHPTSPTVAQCADCSRGLCTICESTLRPPLCADCAELRANVIIRAAYRRATGFGILAIVGFACGYGIAQIRLPHAILGHPLHVGLPSYAAWWLPPLLAYLFGSVVYGRHAISGRRGGTGFIMTFSLLITFGVLLFVAGAIVGPVVTPFAMLADYRLVKTQRLLVAAARRVTGIPLPARVVSARLR